MFRVRKAVFEPVAECRPGPFGPGVRALFGGSKRTRPTCDGDVQTAVKAFRYTTIVCGLALLPLQPMREPATRVTATRVAQNPLITVSTSPSLGDNVNGPSIIRVPSWIPHPLGRYYAYFGHHKGRFIRLAYADAIAGPWKIYEPGVVPVSETAFYRPQPDPDGPVDQFYTHVASPEIYVDEARKRLVLWTHGWWTDGQRWPLTLADARAWAREKGYGQFTQSSESTDGLHFALRPAITKVSYLRVFPYGDYLYGMARLGQLLRSKDPLAAFEMGPNPFAGGPYADRVRHVATVLRGHTLFVFFTGIGDAPERVLLSTIDLAGDWQTWKASAPTELLRPEAPYECPDLPNVPSAQGEIEGPARQLRDPGIVADAGKTYLFYSICGEQGLAAAELTFR
jgi:hypothetical protein